MTKYHARIAQIKAEKKAVSLTHEQLTAALAAAALAKEQAAAKAAAKAALAEKKALRREAFLEAKASGMDTSRIRKRSRVAAHTDD